jgi:hypothetical protein
MDFSKKKKNQKIFLVDFFGDVVGGSDGGWCVCVFFFVFCFFQLPPASLGFSRLRFLFFPWA